MSRQIQHSTLWVSSTPQLAWKSANETGILRETPWRNKFSSQRCWITKEQVKWSTPSNWLWGNQVIQYSLSLSLSLSLFVLLHRRTLGKEQQPNFLHLLCHPMVKPRLLIYFSGKIRWTNESTIFSVQPSYYIKLVISLCYIPTIPVSPWTLPYFRCKSIILRRPTTNINQP